MSRVHRHFPQTYGVLTTLLRFPMGPRHTATLSTDLLNAVIRDGAWSWPLITNIESVEIIHSLPIIFGGEDRIVWAAPRGMFTSASAYAIFCPPGPKVGSSLLLGNFKIPRHRFILWLAILGKLSTLDKPWLHHLDSDCVLCSAAVPESHEHLFFRCQFTLAYLCEIRWMVWFPWPYTSWSSAVLWASKRWRGQHIMSAAYRALLAALVYHVWRERNNRIFQSSSRSPRDIALIIVREVRELLLVKSCLQL
ncbi:UNVERIFIED_CONTAM: hypothetical protein Slati_0882800 [Sesamum latifolium]|uniref:Reverse transcriptase zinc-binding domain-containing protein n=1 Tax=Sesamum latifolium TaxID=2727402 RepID=A0AAW2XNZ9_9LAMI